MAYNPLDNTVARFSGNGLAPAEDYQQSQKPMMASVGSGIGLDPATAREVASTLGHMQIAKTYPRDLNRVLRDIEASCSRMTLAESAIYTYARGGTNITGPSIRLAEMLINSYGNAKSGFEIISSDSESSKVRAYAYDLQTNTIQERTFDVPHIRQTKAGRTKLTDPRDIYETIANQAARRERACILAIIPGDLVDYAVNLCNETLKANVNITPQTLQALQESFAKMGVSKASLEAFIQRKLTALTTDQYLRLKSIYKSIIDGIGKPEDYFDLNAEPLKETVPAQAETVAPASKPQQKKGAARAKAQTAPQQETPKAATAEDSSVTQHKDPEPEPVTTPDDEIPWPEEGNVSGPEDFTGDLFDE